MPSKSKLSYFDAKVQLEGLVDPYNDRSRSNGNKRMRMNAVEKYIVRKNNTLTKFIEEDITFPQAMEQAGIDDRQPASIIQEMVDDGIAGPIFDRLAEKFLDPVFTYTDQELAEFLGIGVVFYKKLIESSEFQESYNNYFLKLVDDPRIKATQQRMAQLAPLVYSTYFDLLRPENSPTIRLKAANAVAKLLKIEREEGATSNRAELAEFLSGKGIDIEKQQINIIQNQNNFEIPDDYKAALLGEQPKIIEDED